MDREPVKHAAAQNRVKSEKAVMIADIALHLALIALMMYKAFNGRRPITDLLLDQSAVYWAIALGLVISAVRTVIKKSDAVRLAMTAALIVVSCIIIALIIVDAVTSEYYTSRSDMPAELDAVMAEDVFNDIYTAGNQNGTLSVSSDRPLFGTSVCRVEQYFDDGKFNSIRINSSSGLLLDGFVTETLKYLSREYDAQYVSDGAGGYVGELKLGATCGKFVIRREGRKLVCVAYSGDGLVERNIVY